MILHVLNVLARSYTAMLKYYLNRSGQIPTSVHPFVKRQSSRQATETIANPVPNCTSSATIKSIRDRSVEG
ncbi:MAG: hypothetical protein F6J86_21520 [Symploca sp. SIO1B1]|nr:hypothetical protein [Symploca sp. SIO1B1]